MFIIAALEGDALTFRWTREVFTDLAKAQAELDECHRHARLAEDLGLRVQCLWALQPQRRAAL